VNRPVRLSIDRITVSAASGLEARRLADALPGALEQAMRLAARLAHRRRFQAGQEEVECQAKAR
jgi:hypothetical protein